MKRPISALIALTLLAGTPVMAQREFPGQQGQNSNPRADDRDGPGGNRNDRDRYDRDRNDRDRNDQSANRNRRDDPSVRAGNPRWSRGDRLPDQFRQNRYVANDWRDHGLRQPPRGYHWVRNDNNDFFLVAISTGLISELAYRDDRDQMWRQRYSGGYSYNNDSYYRECRNSPDPAGIIAGALLGGLLGNAAGNGGGRTGTTVAGVVVGGAVGAALTNNLNCEDRSYAYKTYAEGFNAGRPNAVYRWQNPRDDHRGEFRVGTYYNDGGGFRCANYTQSVYVQGRPQVARGKACRQPDGTWAIIS